MYEERRAIYDTLVAMDDRFERKGKTMPYTSANGHMFSQLNKDGDIGIRLPKEVGKAFMEAYGAGPFLSYGAVMKDYVTVPADLLDDLDTVAEYLGQGYDYVMSMDPPKPKKKK